MPTALAFVLLIMLSPRAARAHEVGLSRGDYEVAGSEVTARLSLANRDVASVPADTFARGLVVRGDGALCPTSTVSTTPLETDGTLVVVRAACPAPPKSVAVEALFLADLPFGHKHLAHANGADATLTISKRTFSVTANGAPPTRPSAWRFLGMGVEHILTGYDHLVFLLGLVIVCVRARELALVVTAFTLGHSLSLALATLSAWAPSARVVEPLIALSIAYVGVENLYSPQKRWRITLPFGLVHGFGFASALRELSLPRAELPAALALFNLGVEVGQLAVLAGLVPLVLRAQRRPRFATHGVRAVSIAVAAAGFVWFAVRVLSG